jgi:hypothetical protein
MIVRRYRHRIAVKPFASSSPNPSALDWYHAARRTSPEPKGFPGLIVEIVEFFVLIAARFAQSPLLYYPE